jgi:hypothetical protein
MTSGSDDYDSRTGLDVNALSSSQRGAALILRLQNYDFFGQLIQKCFELIIGIVCVACRPGFTPPAYEAVVPSGLD